MSTRTRTGARAWVRAHPILAGALACALVGTAHAEYTLATSTDVNKWVALAVPGALDLYVIQALRVHRDVAGAVLAMVVANVVSHLIVAGLYPTDIRWQVGVTAAVGALAPGIVWRVHSLERTRNRAELLWGLEAGAVKSPEKDTAPEPAPVAAPDPSAAWVPGFHLDGCDGVHEYEGPLNCTLRASALEDLAPEPAPVIAPALDYGWSAPDRVPAEWSAPRLYDASEIGDALASKYENEVRAHLEVVPDLPAEHATSAVHSDSPLIDTDRDYLPRARAYVEGTSKPSVRGIRRELHIGQERAERLLTHLGVIL